MSRFELFVVGAMAVGAAGLSAMVAAVAAQGHAEHGAPSPAPSVQAPRRVTIDELHRTGGVPKGWKFTLPAGDAGRGRQVFADLECYKCHALAGESFPDVPPDPQNVGPELTGMGAHHPAEYLAESVLIPNSVIVEGPGFTGPDGLSIMPTFADALTVPQLVDLVAYLKSQTTGAPAHEHDPAAGGAAEKVIGDYRIRLVYAVPGDEHGGHGDSGHGAHQHGTRPPAGGTPTPEAKPGAAVKPPAGHLMAFIASAETGEPVPYLPVRATFFVSGKPPRSVKLAPMLGGDGFHYGADVAIPEGTDTIRLNIGAPAVRAMPAAKGRFAKSTTAVFEWP
jgi:mono/diheme cytochrome c family protein